MASLTDFIQANNGGNNLAFQYATQVPQYRLNETPAALQEDASVATSRALQNYSTRQLPQLVNSGAAQGQWGSSGLSQRADWLGQDTANQTFDVQRMLSRNMANLAQQRVMAAMGAFI